MTISVNCNNPQWEYQKKINGFTIVELTVVIVLLAIVAAFALPRFFSSTPFTDRSTTQQFQSAINYARNRAVTTQCTIEVRINTSGWSVWRDDDCSSGPGATCPNPYTFAVAINNVGESTQLTGDLSLDAGSGNALERLYFTPQGLLYRDNASSSCLSLPANPVAANTQITNFVPSAILRLDGLTGYAALQ